VEQAESLVRDEQLRKTIVANARQLVETEYNTDVEHQGYTRLTTGMCRTPTTNIVDDVAVNSDDMRVRFRENRSKAGQVSKTEATEDGVRFLPSEVSDKPAKSILSGGAIKASCERSDIFSASAADRDGTREPETSKNGGTDGVKLGRNPATSDSTATTATRPQRSPRDATSKSEGARRRSSESSAAKGNSARDGGTAGKNGPNQATASESKGAKKATANTSKSTSPNVDVSANKTGLQPPQEIIRSVSDPTFRATPRATAVNVGSKSTSRRSNGVVSCGIVARNSCPMIAGFLQRSRAKIACNNCTRNDV